LLVGRSLQKSEKFLFNDLTACLLKNPNNASSNIVSRVLHSEICSQQKRIKLSYYGCQSQLSKLSNKKKQKNIKRTPNRINAHIFITGYAAAFAIPKIRMIVNSITSNVDRAAYTF
jgi:hypothetical protein